MAATPHGAALSNGAAPQGLQLKGALPETRCNGAALFLWGFTMEQIILSVAANTALHDALTKRGPRKGRLLKSAPAYGSAAYAAWQAAMLNCNPHKVSMSGVMFLTPENKAIYDEIDALFESMMKYQRENMMGKYD